MGLGYAGTAAFRGAVEAGADTIAIEYMKEKRFSSYGRDIGHLNSKFLESRGVPHVDELEFFNEWMRRAGNRANPELVMKFAKKSGEAFDWFVDMIPRKAMDEMVHVAFWPTGSEKFKAEAREKGYAELNGFKYWNGTAQFPYDYPMGWKGWPTLSDVCRENHKKTIEQGGRAFFGIEAMQLVKDGDRVTGVIGKDRESGEYIQYNARKAVILAAGDFAHNPEMLEELACDITDLLTPDEKYPRNPGRNGRGHQMAVWVGGRMETRPLPTMGGNQLNSFGGMCSFGAVWLDRFGKRYCNEIFGAMEFPGLAANQTTRGATWRVYDIHCLENELAWSVPAHASFDGSNPEFVALLENLFEYAQTHDDGVWNKPAGGPFGPKQVYYGRIPEELVKNAGFTGELAENVINSIHRYNEFARNGRDEDFGRDAKVLDPLTDMLFIEPKEANGFGGMLVTVGGLVTDADQRVLDLYYERIPGLYATGNCCGRRFGTLYFTPIAGVSIGIAITLGREAGIAAATLE